MGGISPLDATVVAILIVAALRGLSLGLIREGFSVAALGGAFVAVRYLTSPAAARLQELTDGQVSPGMAPWIAGSLIALATIGLVVTLGRILRRGTRWAGLGWADRIAGAVLGAAEGALVATVVLVGTTWVVGRDHPVVASARSVAAFEQVRALVQAQSTSLPDVAAPRDWRTD